MHHISAEALLQLDIDCSKDWMYICRDSSNDAFRREFYSCPSQFEDQEYEFPHYMTSKCLRLDCILAMVLSFTYP